MLVTGDTARRATVVELTDKWDISVIESGRPLRSNVRSRLPRPVSTTGSSAHWSSVVRSSTGWSTSPTYANGP